MELGPFEKITFFPPDPLPQGRIGTVLLSCLHAKRRRWREEERGQGLFHSCCHPPIAPLGAMTALEVQAAQTPSGAVIVFAFLLVILVCTGGGRPAKALSHGGYWDLEERNRHCCCRQRQQRQQRHGTTSPRTGHGKNLAIVGSVATLDGGQSWQQQQRRRRTTRSSPRQSPQERSRQFESHVGVADLDVVHNDGAPDRGSCSRMSEQTRCLPEGHGYPLPIHFFGVVAGQRFAGVMPDNGL